jgi:hypothetical protein
MSRRISPTFAAMLGVNTTSVVDNPAAQFTTDRGVKIALRASAKTINALFEQG